MNRSERQQNAYGTLERNKRICRAYAADIPMKELVRIFGISRVRIIQIVKRGGGNRKA
mgnify:CR=1 FL=1